MTGARKAGGVPVTALLVAAGLVALVSIVGAVYLLPGRTSVTVPPSGSDKGTTGTQVVPQPSNPDIAAASARPVRSGATGAPAWQAGKRYAIGDRVSYADRVYQCRQAHSSLPGWEPPNAPALWLPLP